LDKYDLPDDTTKTLAGTVAFLKANPGAKAYISGFHDPSGSQQRNEDLAQNRARAARSALEGAGISREQIVMDKPQVTTGTGQAQEARRVEVTVKR
jgi:K(+)-stimulated pyrophosphate-energized sodium pump